MRPCHASTVLAVLVAAAGAVAAPPDVPADPVMVPVGRDHVVRVPSAGKPFTAAPGFGPEAGLWFPGERDEDGSQTFLFRPYREGEFRVVLWTEGDGRNQYSTYRFRTGAAPAPPGPGPDPTPPGPKPDPPTPAPEGFRVIWVYESSAPMTPAQQQVMFGEKVRTYLDARAKGWRRYDKDVDAANEKDAEIKALWQAAKPKVTTVPCVVVATGGKAEIIPLPASEDEALAVLKKYAEGK